MSIEQEKLNALNQALGKIEKEFGKGSVMKLGKLHQWQLMLYQQDQ